MYVEGKKKEGRGERGKERDEDRELERKLEDKTKKKRTLHPSQRFLTLLLTFMPRIPEAARATGLKALPPWTAHVGEVFL